MKKTVKILAIDGGGIRGILPAIILAEIERRTGQQIANLFDLVAGSSTGGLLALALNTGDEQGQPRFTAEEMIHMYEVEGRTIFSRSMLHSVLVINYLNGVKYPSSGISSTLGRYFGDAMLSEAIGDVLVTSYETKRNRPWFFRSYEARKQSNCDFRMFDVARATTAAPAFFEPAKVTHPDLEDDYFTLIDGSFNTPNPTLSAYLEAKQMYPDAEHFVIVSLGTGNETCALDYEQTKEWGLAGWGQHIMSIALHSMSDVIDKQVQYLLPQTEDGRQHYYRFQSQLCDGVNMAFDDASPQNIEALKKLGRTMIEENEAELDSVAEQLLL